MNFGIVNKINAFIIHLFEAILKGGFFMKSYKVQQIKCIQEQTAEEFERRVNEALMSIDYPKIEMDKNVPFTCYIFFTKTFEEPETVAERYELQGMNRTCADCPHLERTSDRRRKMFPCPYSEYGITRITTPACDRYYIEMEQTKHV